MIHSPETQKLLEALANLVPEDQRPAFGDAAHAFLDSLTEDEAGELEINVFATAARALSDLNAEMRDRTLRALRALLLERGPTPLDRFVDTAGPVLAAGVVEYLKRQPAAAAAATAVSPEVEQLFHAEVDRGQIKTSSGFYETQDAYVAELNKGLNTVLVNDAVALVKNEDGSFEFKSKV